MCYNISMSRSNTFTIIVNGNIGFKATRKQINYGLGPCADFNRAAIYALPLLESANVTGMVVNIYGFNVQINAEVK